MMVVDARSWLAHGLRQRSMNNTGRTPVVQGLTPPQRVFDDLLADVDSIMRGNMAHGALLEDACRCMAALVQCSEAVADSVFEFCEVAYKKLLQTMPHLREVRCRLCSKVKHVPSSLERTMTAAFATLHRVCVAEARSGNTTA
jgi:hypothetical protein